ncbi:MAG TPA: 2'-5' RNA ligase family protein [Acidimicrobiia bacterium]|nr:2'-5' RNA ligase family protein [Acidimicrobiia bacterium]
MPPFTIARSDPRGKWITQVSRFAQDNSDSVVVTVEPLPSEKSLLAVPGGEPAENLHVTLAFLVGGVSELGDAGRQAISAALATIANETAPFLGEVAGIGWFKDPGTITLALIDAEGLSALRTSIADALAEAGYPLDTTHDFVPHLTLAYSPVEASDRAGMPLSFNEIRLRWGNDVMAFDLMGIPQAPDAPPVESPEVAPTQDEAPMPEAPPMPEEALVADYQIVEDHPACMGTTEGPVAVLDDAGEVVSCHLSWDEAQVKIDDLVATDPGLVEAPVEVNPAIVAAVQAMVEQRRAAREQFDMDITEMEPATEEAPTPPDEMAGDLSMMSDDELAMEIARRIAEVAAGDTGDPAMIQEQVLAEVTEALAEILEEAGETPDEEAVEPPEDAEIPPATPASQAVATRKPVVAGSRRAARRRVARAKFRSERAIKVAAAAVDEIAPAPAAGQIQADPSRKGGMPSLHEFESVLTVEGTPSGDGRLISEGCLTWRDLPLPLMLQTINAPGHDGSVFCGWIQEIERVDNAIMGRGNFAKGPDGDKAREILGDPASSGKFGVSVDIDSVSVVFADPSGVEMSPDEAVEAKMFGGGDIVEMMVGGRIMGATMTPFPAFQEAFVYLLAPVEGNAPLDATPAVVASVQGDLWRSIIPVNFSFEGSTTTEALVASASGPDPDAPPAAWFTAQPMDEPESFVVHPDGRCYGLVAEWGTCHIGNSRRCVEVPKSNDFRSFYTGKRVLTREGSMVATGPIFMDTVHPNLLSQASDAQAFYAHTGCAVADVRLFTNEWGIVAAGAIRPDASRSQIRRLRASDISPDWRPMDGEHKLVSLLAVNTSGFLVEGIAASAGRFQPWGIRDSITGEVGALVAAGAIHHDRDDPQSLREQLASLVDEIADLRGRFDQRDNAASRQARLAALDRVMGFGADEDCGCGGKKKKGAKYTDETPDPDADADRFIDDGVGLIIDGAPVF